MNIYRVILTAERYRIVNRECLAASPFTNNKQQILNCIQIQHFVSYWILHLILAKRLRSHSCWNLNILKRQITMMVYRALLPVLTSSEKITGSEKIIT